MQREIRLSDAFSVDAIEYASRANAILGIRDSGKTYSATKIAEQLHACGIPFVALDPIGRWRFLQVPGAGPGIPVVVAGGAAPDLPLDPGKVDALVRAAMQSGVSLVIDLYSIGLSKSDWRKIVRTAVETMLYEGDGYGLRHVFLEEAAEFIPQHVRDGMTYAAVEKLARMGGNIGLGLTLINQRAEEVNKAVLELCDGLLLHRQRGKNSLLSLRKWLTAGNVDDPKKITDTLADLPTAQCWGWFKDMGAPRLVHVGRKDSFDPNRRAMTKAGSVKLRPIDVSGFITKMRNALAGKPAAPTANPPAPEDKDVKESEAKKLRQQNEELEREVARLRARLDTTPDDGAHERKPLLTSPPAPASAPDIALDMDAIYAAVVARARKDPAVLKILTSHPEIEVTVQRRKIEMDGTTYRGRIARMLADGFLDDGQTNSAVRTELKRTGKDMDNRSIGRALDELVSDGFMVRNGSAYVAVPGMKVNIKEQG